MARSVFRPLIVAVVAVVAGCAAPAPAPAPAAAPAPALAPDLEARKALEKKLAVEKRESATSTMNDGVEAFNNGDVAAALEAFNAAISIDPSFAAAHFNLGQAKEAMKRFDDAARAFAEAKRIEPSNAHYHYRYGKTQWRLGNAETALVSLDRSLTLDPRLFKAHEVRGRALLELVRHREAAASFTRAIEIEPQHGPAVRALARLYSRWRYRSEAIAVLEWGAKHAVSSADRAWLFGSLGSLLGDEGRHAEAVAVLNMALKENPLDGLSTLLRAQSLLALGDRKRARADFQAAINAGIRDPLLIDLAAQGMRRASSGRSRTAVVADKPSLAATSLPAIPLLVAPAANVGGIYRVERLFYEGASLFGTEVQVRGVIAWIYDCAVALTASGLSKSEARKKIADDPSQCVRPHFVLLDKRGDDPKDGIRVVEVPRPPRADERKVLSKEELANRPAIPKLSVGDTIIVRGQFNDRSPRGFRDTEGLLVYKSLRSVP